MDNADNTDKRLEDFFSEYEVRFNKALSGEYDIEETADLFADYFIEANPFGVQAARNDDLFRLMIPKGYEFSRSIGTRSMIVDSIKISYIDGYHSMAKVHWRAFYDKKDGDEEIIEFDVIYFVQIIGEKPKIFAYITGDEQGILRERGLIP